MAIPQVSFQGTFLIPYSELKDDNAHAKMRAIGHETSKFADLKDMQQTKDGILVNVDDKKDKEYQAVIAKYGVNVRKVNTPASGKNQDALSYRYMISKLYPNIAEKEAKRYEKLPEGEYKTKLYLDTYIKFKNSPYAFENEFEQNI